MSETALPRFSRMDCACFMLTVCHPPLPVTAGHTLSLTAPSLPQPRTLAYQAALTHNPSLMRGATVLDVGCGTSILSLFAAQGGAAAVVGLDGSARIAGFARQVGRVCVGGGAQPGPRAVVGSQAVGVQPPAAAGLRLVAARLCLLCGLEPACTRSSSLLTHADCCCQRS